MADEELSFLDETSEAEVETPDAPEESEVSEVEPQGEAEPEQAEDTGEKEVEEPQEVTPPVAVQEAQPAGEAVSEGRLTALLDEREKRQKAEQELDQLRAKQRSLEVQQQQAQQKSPDWFDDPQAAANHQAQVLQQQVLNDRLNQSQFLAEREFGKELVGEVEAFVRQNPQVVAQFQQHPSPWHAAVEHYQKQQFLNEVGNDPAAYKERLREEIKAEILAGAKPPQPQQPKAPPPSMSSAPSAGNGDAIVPGDTFDTMFSG